VQLLQIDRQQDDMEDNHGIDVRDEVFFDFEYSYRPNGRCASVKTTNANGVVKVRRYDRKGRPAPDNPRGLW
jgi:hypothetical protein